jgi:hypothetical protein
MSPTVPRAPEAGRPRCGGQTRAAEGNTIMPRRSPVLCLLTLLTCLGAATLAVPPPATARAPMVVPLP